LTLLAAFAGCDAGGGSVVPPASGLKTSSPPVVPASPVVPAGRLEGTAAIAGASYYLTGVLTSDGEMRMFLGPEGREHDEGSMQLAGSLAASATRTAGTGVVFGQACASPIPSRFCAAAAPVTITLQVLAGVDPRASGEVRVTTSTGEEVWAVSFGYWGGQSGFWSQSPLPSATGIYEETLAEFARASDVVMSIDAAGRLFFQSPATACVGNGLLRPKQQDAYDVELTMANCDPAHGYLNGEFRGLSVLEGETPWDYGGPEWHKVWLSMPASAAAPAAMTMLARAIY
jgi:hypothetical protein